MGIDRGGAFYVRYLVSTIPSIENDCVETLTLDGWHETRGGSGHQKICRTYLYLMINGTLLVGMLWTWRIGALNGSC